MAVWHCRGKYLHKKSYTDICPSVLVKMCWYSTFFQFSKFTNQIINRFFFEIMSLKVTQMIAFTCACGLVVQLLNTDFDACEHQYWCRLTALNHTHTNMYILHTANSSQNCWLHVLICVRIVECCLLTSVLMFMHIKIAVRLQHYWATSTCK